MAPGCCDYFHLENIKHPFTILKVKSFKSKQEETIMFRMALHFSYVPGKFWMLEPRSSFRPYLMKTFYNLMESQISSFRI